MEKDLYTSTYDLPLEVVESAENLLRLVEQQVSQRVQAEIKIEQLQTALHEIILESGKVDVTNWPVQQQVCQAIAQVALQPKAGEKAERNKK